MCGVYVFDANSRRSITLMRNVFFAVAVAGVEVVVFFYQMN